MSIEISTMKMIIPSFRLIVILLDRTSKHLTFASIQTFLLVKAGVEKSFLKRKICLDKYFLYVEFITGIEKSFLTF